MGRTILETALAQGIDYPHGCRSGNCGACKSVLHSGEVEMSPYSEFALTAEEKDRGLILACRSVPWSDCEISPIDEDEAEVHASRNLNCRVTELVQATHDIKIVRLEIENGAGFDFSAGQYAELTFPGLPPRDFSMANQPGAATLEFHIRAMAGGAVSSHVADELKPGDPVTVKGPLGAAYYRPNHKGPIIAAAGGSGLAPIKSIIEKALAGGAEQDIHFYFGIRDERDLYLEDHVLDLCGTHPNLTFTPVLSEPRDATDRRTGFIADILAEDFTDLDGYKSYLAGPPVMVETSVEKLTVMGMARLDCHADAFYTEAEKAALE
jgi:CDP-4-dehydro-6-deoxyglucose reductase/ferredoxin-NAD(P)+ reductase (naphthalene dioxygenase ferredoxin-specific)